MYGDGGDPGDVLVLGISGTEPQIETIGDGQISNHWGNSLPIHVQACFCHLCGLQSSNRLEKSREHQHFLPRAAIAAL